MPRPTPRQLRIATIGAAVVAVVAVVALLLGRPVAPPAPGATASSPTASTTIASSVLATASPVAASTGSPQPSSLLVAAELDGVLVESSLAHRLPIAVSIDDAVAARPQSGFNAAAIVYQAPVDGYETRYLMIFQERDATTIGPVRSGRLYLAQWASEYGSIFGHYGGDRITRAWMAANSGSQFTDVDGITSGNPAYSRVRFRQAPHNAYASSTDLRRVGGHLGAPALFDARLHRRPFRDDTPLADRPASETITIPYNTVTVGYDYDPATDAYARSLDGQAQVDPLDGNQVSARTVIVLYMPFRTDTTIEPGHDRPVLGFIGSGEARIFMEGRQIDGRWTKLNASAPTVLRGTDGAELALVRGRIFFQIVPLGTRVRT